MCVVCTKNRIDVLLIRINVLQMSPPCGRISKALQSATVIPVPTEGISALILTYKEGRAEIKKFLSS